MSKLESKVGTFLHVAHFNVSTAKPFSTQALARELSMTATINKIVIDMGILVKGKKVNSNANIYEWRGPNPSDELIAEVTKNLREYAKIMDKREPKLREPEIEETKDGHKVIRVVPIMEDMQKILINLAASNARMEKQLNFLYQQFGTNV